MNATAVEKITPQPKQSRQHYRPDSSARNQLSAEAGIPGITGNRCGCFASFSGLVQKWLWMRQLDYVGIFWTLLSVRWGLFGLTLFISILYLWTNLRLAARNIDMSEGTSFFSKAFTHPADATRDSQHRSQPKNTCICYRCGYCCPLAALCVQHFQSMGHIPPLSLRRAVRGCGTLFLVLTWGFTFSPSVL